jgi:hypothetical protein
MTTLDIYTVYAFPLDYPEHYVVRKFRNDVPTDWCRIALTLEEVRSEIPPGLIRLLRDPYDDAPIVEMWL